MESDIVSEVRKAVSNIVDPEIGLTLGELNLIKDVRSEGDKVVVEFVATTPFCPLAEVLAMMVRDTAKEAAKSKNVTVYIRNHVNEEVINERVNRE
ncbi:MAG: iron-sulfur cluster assembly protein [Crenarchaeota archaeon]|nr:iron-sulfur cluster assembly protein [Thermoproteota archaeon]MDW8033881.1 iron-sulfur cluster assembly protein [Nitrososphaerota archaeon]